MHVSIGQAAALLGVSISSLSRWEKEEVFSPAYRTCGAHRQFALATLEALFRDKTEAVDTSSRVIAYARVSSFDQKKDLDTQKEKLENYYRQHFENFELTQTSAQDLIIKNQD